MAPGTWFIDTSILDHIVAVPGKSKEGEEREQVLRDLKERTKAGHTFLLPITAVVETGNHISKVKVGNRRAAAERFANILRMVVEGKAPWVLDEVQWDGVFLQTFLDGDGTGESWVNLASRGAIGGGDLSILVERQQYCERTGRALSVVGIWTLDKELAARS